MSVIRQPLLEWCSSTLTELGDSVGAKEHAWRDIAVPADQWQEVLSSARAHHAAGTLFRTKDTVVTVEADEEDVSLLEEEGRTTITRRSFQRRVYRLDQSLLVLLVRLLFLTGSRASCP